MLVSKIELEHGVSAGVLLKSFGADMVSIFEEQETRIENAISLDMWSEMHETEKALLIAARRTRIAIKNLSEEAQIREHEKRVRKK